MRKAKTAPKIAAIQRICRAVVSPHVSAPQPTSGENRPPMVVLSPSVTPEAKPIFLLKKVCPSTTIGLYGAKSENATGIKRIVDSHKFVLLVKHSIVGIMIRKEARIMRIKPKRSAIMPPMKVITAPRKKRMDSARLPCEGEAFRTCIQ